jgi:hypothetical protein
MHSLFGTLRNMPFNFEMRLFEEGICVWSHWGLRIYVSKLRCDFPMKESTFLVMLTKIHITIDVARMNCECKARCCRAWYWSIFHILVSLYINCIHLEIRCCRDLWNNNLFNVSPLVGHDNLMKRHSQFGTNSLAYIRISIPYLEQSETCP